MRILYHACLVTVTFVILFEINIVIIPGLFFLFRIMLTIRGLLCLHMDFRIVFSNSVESIELH